MAILPQHKFFCLNTKIRPAEQYFANDNEGSVYEVLRIIQGIPLFLEDHLHRLIHSAQLAGKRLIFSEAQIHSVLNKLMAANEIFDGNVMISYNDNLRVFFIPHSYPTPEMYRDGVICGILDAERENPNVKAFQTQVRQKADLLIEEKGFYEVLLADQSGHITEGSRSNVFFVTENELVTAPAKKVLTGITRQKALHLAAALNIRATEREILHDELQYFDSAFITGTSPKILPIRQIDVFEFDTQNEIVQLLIKSYDSVIEGYLNSFLKLGRDISSI